LPADDIAAAFFAQDRRVDINRPSIRTIADPEVGEDLIVEFVLAAKHLIDQREKGAGLRALRDAMIVSAGYGHHLADPDARESFGRHRLILRWVADRAG